MYRLYKDHVIFLCTTLKIIFVHFAQKPNNIFVQYAENYFCIKWRILGFKWDNVCAIFPVDKLLRMCYYWNSGLTSRRRPEVWWIASLRFMYFSQIKPKERSLNSYSPGHILGKILFDFNKMVCSAQNSHEVISDFEFTT